MRKLKRCVVGFGTVLVVLFASPRLVSERSNRVPTVSLGKPRIVRANKGIGVEIPISAAIGTTEKKLENPPRLVIDFPGGEFQPQMQRIGVNQSGVIRIRTSQWQLNPPVARLVMDLSNPLAYKMESVPGKVIIVLGTSAALPTPNALATPQSAGGQQNANSGESALPSVRRTEDNGPPGRELRFRKPLTAYVLPVLVVLAIALVFVYLAEAHVLRMVRSRAKVPGLTLRGAAQPHQEGAGKLRITPSGSALSLRRGFALTVFLATAFGVSGIVYEPTSNRDDLPNRLPEAAPYVLAEAESFAPPFEKYWQEQDNPGQCATCHARIFEQWNGSMMSNAWRDPVWRGAFLLSARETSAYGDCDTPNPPDGTEKAKHNPFARIGECSSVFDIGGSTHTVSRPGSLLDGFCSRCHMPANYLDNVPLHNVKVDPANGLESASLDPKFNPTSDNGTGIAFATLDAQFRNTDAGRSGIFCAICHSFAETRDTPFHNYATARSQYAPAPDVQSRGNELPKPQQDTFQVPNHSQPNLGYGIGAGSYRLSPHAIAFPERFGPLATNDPPASIDPYLSGVFGEAIPFQHMDSAKHQGYYHVIFSRAEMCASCHDVTNALPIKNPLGKWVGGFPIERTYTEWANSRYADRPGNANFDPRYKRDCQTCHMQQDQGQPGTAHTLYKRDGTPLPAPEQQVASDGAAHPFFTHYFVGGNAYVTHMIGTDVDQSGAVAPYPELSAFSFSSADKKSLYANAYWTDTSSRGAYVQQARLAWDRLRHVLSMDVEGPVMAAAGTSTPISINVANTGSGHNFPTGFPEGRTAWLAVRAYDLASGKELMIHDSFWNRDSLGVGRLTTKQMTDPNFPERCRWSIPPGSVDPYAIQFKAVASQGDGCPTLDLVYAAPLNLVTNARGLPIDQSGRVIDRSNSQGLPQFRDNNGNGDYFDDSYLKDTRLKPMPHKEAQVSVDRYSVIIPPGTRGPVAVAATVYYQSVEGVVAEKFLGNLADTNGDLVLEPCVLGGLCDGRTPNVEPAVVEGAPPVPMVTRNLVISISGSTVDNFVPRVATYPHAGARDVYQDVVVKTTFSQPVVGVDTTTFFLTDSTGGRVAASVSQIGDATWGLFPDQVFLKGGQSYTAHLQGRICSNIGQCRPVRLAWTFTVTAVPGEGKGNTTVPMGFLR